MSTKNFDTFLEVFMHYPTHYFGSLVRPDYKEPENPEEAKELVARLGKVSGDHVKIHSPLARDIYIGTMDGFSYGSCMRFNKMKKCGIRKPVGPVQMYKHPPTQQTRYGWFALDPAIQGQSWYYNRIYTWPEQQKVKAIVKR